jgi:hypothetical protein
MTINNRIISINLFKFLNKIDPEKKVEDMRFPVDSEFYKFGVYKVLKVNSKMVNEFAVVHKVIKKIPDIINNKVIFKETDINTVSLGAFSINNKESILELINCNNIIRHILLNQICQNNYEKYVIGDKQYSLLLQQSFLKKSENYTVSKNFKKFSISVKSDEIEDKDARNIFGDCEIKSKSFSGKFLFEKELSVNIKKDGSLIFYNGTKNPLEWEDIFNFIENHIY